MRSPRDRFSSALGISLIDVLASLAVTSIIAAMAVPLMTRVTDSTKLTSAARDVERELQTARLKAVSANQPMRVRFDCPVTGRYRMVELIGTPSVPAAADTTLGRCDDATYPYPAADRNALTRPNHDGPLRWLDSSVTFVNVQTIEFWPDGTAHANTGSINPWPQIATTGITMTVRRNGTDQNITVNGVGKIQVQP